MPLLLTYDISGQHIAFKQALLGAGYVDKIDGSDGPCNLPNTSLSHPNKIADQGLKDAENLANRLGVKLLRCFATVYTRTDWDGIRGQEHG